ncbi:NAD(P)/FAD-dependent oxidoreductase [Streptomyces sp. UG1]|uniref:NAD(P)/FAD-dependent oxidoreductase n=1 Tax=Streptomyces sp. UG1 TaxID=3417652 RepID=UPI003CF859EB
MSTRSDRIVIVGAGQAGVEAAAALRMAGSDVPITVLGDESAAPYSRPPLSKGILTGTAQFPEIALRTDQFYVREGIDLRVGRAVAGLDAAGRTVHLDDGETIPYESLIIATGSKARMLPHPELRGAANVLTLRTIDDTLRLQEFLRPGARAVVIGGGYIGLEIAAAARRAGVETIILEAADRVLARVTSAPVSDFFQQIHREEGVDVRTGARIAGFRTDAQGNVAAVLLDGAPALEVDFVLVGIGVTPRTELAERAGALVDNGIVVDTHLRTSVPGVYAIGDVSRHPCPQHGGLRRLESAPNASEQARHVARSILGDEAPYSALPWFWSDQYDLKLQSVGLSATADTVVVRPNPGHDRKLEVFYLEAGKLIAADIVGASGDFAFSRKLVESKTVLDPEALADPDVPLRSFLALAGAA